MEKNKIESDFQFIDSYIRNSNLEIFNRNIDDSKLNLSVKVKFSNIRKEKNELTAELRLKNIVKIIGKDKENVCVQIEVEMAGIFKGHNMDNEKFMHYMKYSGTPIISQLIRSYIMNITALSGINTIRIPLINYVEFFKENNKIDKEN